MSTNIQYTLGFIKSDDKVLLLNRQKKPHMGKWNGVGGKIENNETPLQCIIRETKEETNLDIDDYQCRGYLKWIRDGEGLGGVYLFTGTFCLSEAELKTYPEERDEGILSWKSWDWIVDSNNVGIVDNIHMLWNDLWQGTVSDIYKAEYIGLVLNRAYKLEH